MWRGLLVACGLVLLWRLRTVIVWLLLATMFALALDPAVRVLSRRGVRRGWGVAIIALAGTGLGVLFGATLVPLVVEQAQELSARIPELLDRVASSVPVTWARAELGLFERLKAELRSGRLAAPAVAVAAGALHALGAAVTIFFMTVFMLLFGAEAVEQMFAWIEPGRRERIAAVVTRIRNVVGRYVLGTFVIAGMSGITMGITLAIVGVAYFLPLALIVFVLGMIPFLGTTLAAVILVLVTLGSSGLRDAVIVAAVYLVYQQIENHLLLPLVQKRTLKMNPLVISISLLVGGTLAGLPGLLLALPLAGAAQIVLSDALVRRQAGWAKREGDEATS